MIDYADFFPFWRDLDGPQRDTLRNAITLRHVSKGAVLHNGSEDCVGLFLVLKGQLRAYIVSDEGREITLYRLLEMAGAEPNTRPQLHLRLFRPPPA